MAQLIAQANVSASLNTLTGDTVYEVADILFVTTNGVQNLVYTLNISGEFSSARTAMHAEQAWMELPADLTSSTLGTI